MKGKKSSIPGETTTPNTAADTAKITAANTASATNRKQGKNRGKINRNNNRDIVDTEDKNYEVDTPEVGGILALLTENITKKLTVDTFQ